MNMIQRQPRHRSRSRGFTLLELLIVIGILTVLGVLTVISVGGIARDVKLATGINRVMGGLGAARAEAIRSNKPVMLSFRVVKDNRKPGEPDQVEMVIARWTGELRNAMDYGYGSTGTPRFAERFEPVAEIPPQLLPDGIKVAGPYTDFDLVDDYEETWACMSSGPWIPQDIDGDGKIDYYSTQERGEIIGVLFGPDGSLQSRSSSSVSSGLISTYRWIDYDDDNFLQRSTIPSGAGNNTSFFLQNDTNDETFANMVHFLAVYDEKQAQEEVDYSQWVGTSGTTNYIERRDEFLGTWIHENADRIHFNRYTGLAEIANE